MVALLVDVDLLVALHQLRLLIEIVDELAVVALEVVVDHVVEVRLVLDFHLLTIVLQQGSDDFLIGGLVPLGAVVLELDIVSLGLAVLAVDDGTVLHTEGPAGHLVSTPASEGLRIVSQSPHGSKALLVELSQLLEVELAFQESCRVLPLTDLLLVFCLLLDKPDGIDTFVHTDGVLPVV